MQVPVCRIQGAANHLLEFANTINKNVRANKFITDWLTGGFRRRVLGQSF